MTRRSALPLLLSVLLSTLAGCAGDPLGPNAPGKPSPVASVTVAPTALALEVGDGTAVTATLLDRAGTVLQGYTVTWTSTDTTVATVSPAGLITARQPGTTTIRASSEGRSGGVAVAVSPRAVARVDVDLVTLALAVGEERLIVATPRDAAGAPLARSIGWSSGDPAVATVDAGGRVVARGAGTTTLTATSEGRSATVLVDVASQQWRLADLAGAPLPAILYTTTVTRDGVARAARFQLTGGTIRMGSDRYALRLHGWLLVDGASAEATTLAADGAVAYDVIDTGAPLFFEGDDWWNREPRFRSRVRPDGSLELQWKSQPGAAIVPLGFVR
jgi:hypothetical protein